VVLIADDLAAWLISVLTDSGRKRLREIVFGADVDARCVRAPSHPGPAFAQVVSCSGPTS
jgi:hypothetical protein